MFRPNQIAIAGVTVYCYHLFFWVLPAVFPVVPLQLQFNNHVKLLEALVFIFLGDFALLGWWQWYRKYKLNDNSPERADHLLKTNAVFAVLFRSRGFHRS